MSHKERILHMVLFELVALIVMATLATLITGNGAGKMAGLAIALSMIAMGWNYIYNYGYDKVFGADRTKRTAKVRILHGLGYELGMMIISFPVLMWTLQLGFWSVLVMDIGVVIFFVLYSIGFNWVYDAIRQRITTQRLATSA
ncbi:PACE efflux transporter [Vibrio neptunius]|uniref:PACE efflux transporter n=1 Tax=Vibrio neptunius TaxID=170651 RepID=A0ABS3A5Q5_9VIBR|nr:PACE efflux transporter [Vibrio neptunius]MBN3493767.1 PACE efflux transporter [Vibrio neptunius]MBN3516263.1 PACE efflux transporter [Vibrio neptunius]MBN3550208.1 PACE efflux transporter [Vibrio neptunius]MBN3578528.1 PACE efflux transporter [Vibrio neptunius]MCH9872193.1 PACE efflux transporter [Vibrio neptunius]